MPSFLCGSTSGNLVPGLKLYIFRLSAQKLFESACQRGHLKDLPLPLGCMSCARSHHYNPSRVKKTLPPGSDRTITRATSARPTLYSLVLKLLYKTKLFISSTRRQPSPHISACSHPEATRSVHVQELWPGAARWRHATVAANHPRPTTGSFSAPWIVIGPSGREKLKSPTQGDE